MKQSINHSIIRSLNQSRINKSVNERMNESINEPNKSIHQLIKSINRSISEWSNQSHTYVWWPRVTLCLPLWDPMACPVKPHIVWWTLVTRAGADPCPYACPQGFWVLLHRVIKRMRACWGYDGNVTTYKTSFFPTRQAATRRQVTKQ